ncbi:MAG: bifunctional phosphoribosylaminoimidazolecarboxamide formyltransferase/IMP cyclohydrolase [Candidatus Kapabacteria bacterium]|nr:bifunctional phosphoribosylaminoimidazolecarboxamide formyltransferase/IMP cyclohydrolase [Candidatus Kapabacteria bacterium]
MSNSSSHVIKRALISVSDKSGIVEFSKELVSLGVEIFSTGGTADLLNRNGVAVKSVSEMTDFPEILGGRVKTLHPNIHAGILADLGKPDHLKQMQEHAITSIDLLIVNLYPFEEVYYNDNATHEELIENIDIGGPTMLRAAAKNYKWTLPVVNPEQYDEIIELMKKNGNTIPEAFRAKLAGEVFSLTSYYDSLISQYLNKFNKIEIPTRMTIPVNKEYDLRYGENPHQKAALLGRFSKVFAKIHGKELSFNNILDINAAAKLIIEFDEPTVAIIKHTNPCGVGTATTLAEAYQKAFATDTVSPFGGIIAVNRKIDLDSALAMHDIFTEVIIAPDFSYDALELLTRKKDRRLIKADYDLIPDFTGTDVRSVVGGFLLQDENKELFDESKMQIVTQRKPSESEYKALMFAWKICKHVKSNAIVYCADDRTMGIGAGQMSRVDSSRIAVEKAKLMGLDLDGTVVASDAFFPFADGLMEAAKAGATAIIQPGGSVRDEEVIKAADANNLAMIFTGMRHFKH